MAVVHDDLSVVAKRSSSPDENRIAVFGRVEYLVS